MIKRAGKKRPVYELVGGSFRSEHLERTPDARSITPEEMHPGFKVRHKSGGPEMTIIRVLSNSIVECRWHSGEELKPQINRFPAALLTPAFHN